MSGKLVFRHPVARERLDRFLTERCAGMSRSRIKRLIEDGEVLVDGRPVNAGYRLRAGQLVEMSVSEPEPTKIAAQSISLHVLHEDDELLVVDKPAGMPVHPGAGHPDSTLVNATLGLSSGDIDNIQGDVGGARRAGLVHRLDMDTSGVIVVAKTDRAHAHLSAQFKSRTVRKRYIALVQGWPEPPEAVIEAPIGRDPDNRKRMAIVEDGRESTTLYRTLRRYARTALVEAWPRTGRTHQIRVHLASVSHPVVGDATYGHAPVSRDGAIGRQFLHAASLEFEHPATGDRVRFEAQLPEDLAGYLESLST